FEDAAVEGSAAVVTAAREDPELTALLEATEGKHASELIAGTGGAMHHLVKELWHPLFERARAEGRMRTGADEDELVEWIRGVCLRWGLGPALAAGGPGSAGRKSLLPSLSICTSCPAR